MQALGDLGEQATVEATGAFEGFYRRHLTEFIREDFYERCPVEYKARYDAEGEIDVPLLKDGCLAALSRFGDSVEPLGKGRYGDPRPTYPPGEVLSMAAADPRKGLTTDVNMTAVPSRHLAPDSAIQWVYHSPHLRFFLKGVMGCAALYPYLSDLGLAINIMRPMPGTRTALGFHFDSIDSSGRGGDVGAGPQPRGATGVIGILDCVEGGERVTFPDVSRADVKKVARVLHEFDPLQSDATIGGAVPNVCRDPTGGVLFLFNGGDVLHGVSSVRRGTRTAAVFMFKEEPPSETADSKASADFFYDN